MYAIGSVVTYILCLSHEVKSFNLILGSDPSSCELSSKKANSNPLLSILPRFYHHHLVYCVLHYVAFCSEVRFALWRSHECPRSCNQEVRSIASPQSSCNRGCWADRLCSCYENRKVRQPMISALKCFHLRCVYEGE